MTTLREAAQQALEALEYYQHRKLEWDYADEATITDLRAALAQQEQEPVTWGVDWGRNGDQSCCTIIKRHADGTQEVVAVEYGPPRSETEQEPVGRFTRFNGEWKESPTGIPLYTHPPRREWVSLTEEERADILFPLTAAGASDMECARAIEQALKEKNNE